MLSRYARDLARFVDFFSDRLTDSGSAESFTEEALANAGRRLELQRRQPRIPAEARSQLVAGLSGLFRIRSQLGAWSLADRTLAELFWRSLIVCGGLPETTPEILELKDSGFRLLLCFCEEEQPVPVLVFRMEWLRLLRDELSARRPVDATDDRYQLFMYMVWHLWWANKETSFRREIELSIGKVIRSTRARVDTEWLRSSVVRWLPEEECTEAGRIIDDADG